MRREITMEHIRANLIKEYVTKPARKAWAAIGGGIVIALLCFSTGRLPGMLVGLIFAAMGGWELLKSKKWKKKINSDQLIVREGRCIEKRIRSGIDGTKRYFYFTKKIHFIAEEQDVRLWEKTHIGDKFYIVSFQDSPKIWKVYPRDVIKIVNK